NLLKNLCNLSDCTPPNCEPQKHLYCIKGRCETSKPGSDCRTRTGHATRGGAVANETWRLLCVFFCAFSSRQGRISRDCRRLRFRQLKKRGIPQRRVMGGVEVQVTC